MSRFVPMAKTPGGGSPWQPWGSSSGNTPPNTDGDPAYPTNIQFSSISDVSITVSWKRGGGEKCIVVCRKCATLPIGRPANNTVYYANANFGDGDPIADGQFVVYNGTGTSVTVTGLTAETSYCFSIFEYNNGNIEGAESYLFLPGRASQSTSPAIPIIASALDVTATYSKSSLAGDWAAISGAPFFVKTYTNGTRIYAINPGTVAALFYTEDNFASTTAPSFNSADITYCWTVLVSSDRTFYGGNGFLWYVDGSGEHIILGSTGVFPFITPVNLIDTTSGLSLSGISSIVKIGSDLFIGIISSTIDPGDGAAAASYIVYKSTDNGDTWTLKHNGLPDGTFNCTRLYSDGTNLFLADNEDQLFYVSTDEGENWIDISSLITLDAGGSSVLHIQCMAFNGTTIYAGAEYSGVWKSVDAGATWAKIGLDTLSVTSLLYDSNGYLWAGTYQAGVWRTNDDSTWTEDDTGIEAGIAQPAAEVYGLVEGT